MKNSIVILGLLLLLPATTAAQLVVFDNSHTLYANPMYDDFKDQLTAWGYTVESRVTPTMDNGDADVIVILTEDGYENGGTTFTSQEAAWLKDFVDSGKGLLASVCLSSTYLVHIADLMSLFGIAEEGTMIETVYYDQFAAHPLFNGVTELGDDVSRSACLTVSAPSVAVAGDGTYNMTAAYESGTGYGAAIWTTHYYMMDNGGLPDFDNLVFLENAFTWLTRSYVANEYKSWSEIKALYL